MRRRICFAGAAVAAVSLVVGVGMAVAAKPAQNKSAKPKFVVLVCHISLATVPPQGQAYVDQPPAEGAQYGPLECPTATFGPGIEETSFTVPDSGDTVGTYKQFFHAGMVSGTFDITPNESPPLSTTGFYSQTWTGKLTLDKGTGIFQRDKGKKATGKMNCSTTDSGVHMTCTSRIKVKLPPPTGATTTG